MATGFVLLTAMRAHVDVLEDLSNAAESREFMDAMFLAINDTSICKSIIKILIMRSICNDINNL
jgi:hypothetical protein